MEQICYDCPRKCGAKRSNALSGGVCRSTSLPRVVRSAPHYGEEPCISGENGSGAVFFSGCSLRCVFCQNREISRGGVGETLTVAELRDMLLRLRDKGVHNINLVTGSHFVRPIAEALSGLTLGIPVVWNSSGYESVETLKLLEGLVQIYLPDFKYWKSAPAKRYSAAEDYPAVAAAAIREMFRPRKPLSTGRL
jgi:putative pyruvate formate lyase activating enzyme